MFNASVAFFSVFTSKFILFDPFFILLTRSISTMIWFCSYFNLAKISIANVSGIGKCFFPFSLTQSIRSDGKEKNCISNNIIGHKISKILFRLDKVVSDGWNSFSLNRIYNVTRFYDWKTHSIEQFMWPVFFFLLFHSFHLCLFLTILCSICFSLSTNICSMKICYWHVLNSST